jgi:lysophospholipase L1-like esterase
MSRIQRYSANSLLLAVSVAVSLLSLELAARIHLRWFASETTVRRYATVEQLEERFGAEQRIFSPHPYLRFYLTPGYVDEANRHNALGYRGEEIQEKEPDEFRIVCIGGSTTYTGGVSDYRRSYPDLLETHLESMGFDTVNVINAGTPGWSTWESLINFEFRVVDLDPDLIIVYHAVNDVGPRLVWPGDAYRGDNTGARAAIRIFNGRHRAIEHSTLVRMFLIKLGMLRSESDLSFLDRPAETFYAGEFDRQSWRGEYPSGFFSKVSADSLLRTNPPIYYRRNLENLVALARSRGIEVVLATFAILPGQQPAQHSSWHTSEYFRSIGEANEIVRQIADTMGVHLFDFAETFPQDRRLFQTYERAGRTHWNAYHLNEEGADLKAKQFAEFVAENVLGPSASSVQ